MVEQYRDSPGGASPVRSPPGRPKRARLTGGLPAESSYTDLQRAVESVVFASSQSIHCSARRFFREASGSLDVLSSFRPRGARGQAIAGPIGTGRSPDNEGSCEERSGGPRTAGS